MYQTDTYHFWKSDQSREQKRNDEHNQRKLQVRNYALVEGAVVEYDIATATKEHGCGWSDMKYLGKGYYTHSEVERT